MRCSFSFFLFDLLQGQQYETVSGFVCESFGYIPRSGESIKVVLKDANREENSEYSETGSDHQDQMEKNQIYKLVVSFSYC